ncbi:MULTISPECIES: hypothetical protein [Bartonella]|uniref:hypothetical protein n=1 Tax=Bartonella TaxID=773 RepID=UPI0018DD2974|nr:MULTISPECIES: hypothetical protein [Bartonella]MBH9974202.1 hypothetical protein [Bartonella choladocola]MBI0013809.1 hypothetical protein [Bartonella sp. B10834G3]
MSEQTADKTIKKSPWKKIITGLVIIALICGGFVFYLARSAQKHVENFLKANGISVGSLDVNWRRHFTAHNAKVKLSSEESLNVETINGEVNFSGKTSKNLKLENLSYHFGKTEISVPAMSVQNFALNEKTGANNGNVVFDVTNIAVKKIVAPSMIVTRKTGNGGEAMTYNNVVFNDIDKGIVKKLTSDGLSGEVRLAGESDASTINRIISTKTGKAEIDNFNIGYLVRYYSEPSSAGETENPFKDITGNWSVQTLSIDDVIDNENAGNTTIEKISGTKISVRRLPFSLSEMVKQLDNADSNSSIGKSDEARLLTEKLAVIPSIGFADIHLTGLAIKHPDSSANVQDSSFTYNNGKFDIALKGIKTIDRDNETATLDDFSISQLRFPHINDMLTKLDKLDKGDFDSISRVFKAFLQSENLPLMPQFDTIHLSGFSLLPPPSENGSDNSPVTFNSLDVKANFSLGAIPTSLKIDWKGLQGSAADWDKKFPILTELGFSKTTNSGLLSQLGYKTISEDFIFDGSWNADNETLDIKELTMDYPDIGRWSLKGSFVNVDPAFFSDNVMTIAAAGLVIHAKSMDLTVNADNFLDRFAKFYDANTGEKFADKRKEAAVKTRLAVAIFLGAENSQKFGEAVQNFLESGGTLNIHAKAKSGQGVGLADFLAARIAPLSLFDKIDLSADVQH